MPCLLVLMACLSISTNVLANLWWHNGAAFAILSSTVDAVRSAGRLNRHFASVLLGCGGYDVLMEEG